MTLAVSGGMFSQGWFHLKLVLVIAMTVSHVVLARHKAAFAEDRNTRSQKYFRVFNEVPTLLMIAIVILVIVRPF